MFVLAACDAGTNPGNPLVGVLLVLIAFGIYGAVAYAVFRPGEGRSHALSTAILAALLAITVAGVGVVAGLALTAGGIAIAAVVSPAAYRPRVILGGVVGAAGWLLVVALFIGALVGGGGCPFD